MQLPKQGSIISVPCLGNLRRYQCGDNIDDKNNTIEFTKMCDGIADCSDGDDETNFLCDGIRP